MVETFIINEKSVKLDVYRLQESISLAEVTPVGGAWVERITAGEPIATITWRSSDGEFHTKSFQVVGREADETLILISRRPPTVGEELI